MTVEDRLRATTEALSGAMREVRPLTLPSERPGRVSRPREPRRWPGWLVPLTAAVAVIAVAATSVAVHDGRSARPAPPAPVTNSVATTIPRYYVQLNVQPSAPGDGPVAIVGDSRTGKVLTTVRPPAHLTFAGVTGAADDRTFVIDALRNTQTRPDYPPQGPHTWYLLRLAPGTSQPATLTRLPIAELAASDQIDGLALSPEAGTLAVLYQTGVDVSGSPGPFTLRTFSLTTGKALRTWTAPYKPRKRAGHMPVLDNAVDLTWTSDGRTLAFVFPPATWPGYERTLNVIRKGTNLLADSRSVLAIPGNQNICLSLLLASDGRTMVCSTVGNPLGGCSQQEPEFDQYSTATGKLIRVLYRYRGSCTGGVADLVWAGVSGTVIGTMVIYRDTKGKFTTGSTIGLLTPGKFTPLHVQVPAGYGFITGDIAF